MDDLISRQAAINAIENTDAKMSMTEWDEITDAVMSVPSAQSEIIRCKDCKHHVLHKRLSIPWCRLLHMDMGDDQFCSCAERRKDE